MIITDRPNEELPPQLWFPDFNEEEMVGWLIADGDDYDRMMAERGLLFETEEEAKEAALKMLAALKKEVAA